MTEILRRSFVKGLFLAAASPLVTSIPVLAHSNLASATIYEHGAFGVSRLIPIQSLVQKVTQPLTPRIHGDPETLGRFLYDYIHDKLDYLNTVALEPNDDFTRHNIFNGFRQDLETRRQNRTLYEYSVIMDKRNNTEDMIERNAKSVEVYIKPVMPLSVFYGIKFGYDPLLA